MEVKKKVLKLDGMSGYYVEGANISLCIDDITDSYSVAVLGVHQRGEFEYITKEELELLMRLFKIEIKGLPKW